MGGPARRHVVAAATVAAGAGDGDNGRVGGADGGGRRRDGSRGIQLVLRCFLRTPLAARVGADSLKVMTGQSQVMHQSSLALPTTSLSFAVQSFPWTKQNVQLRVYGHAPAFVMLAACSCPTVQQAPSAEGLSYTVVIMMLLCLASCRDGR